MAIDGLIGSPESGKAQQTFYAINGTAYKPLDVCLQRASIIVDVKSTLLLKVQVMLSLCDGCERLFEGEPKTFNAKRLKPSICNVPYEESESCGNIECYYNLEAECCVDFQFCEKCFSNKQIIDATFVSFVKI